MMVDSVCSAAAAAGTSGPAAAAVQTLDLGDSIVMGDLTELYMEKPAERDYSAKAQLHERVDQLSLRMKAAAALPEDERGAALGLLAPEMKASQDLTEGRSG